jgi:hypothetical protein
MLETDGVHALNSVALQQQNKQPKETETNNQDCIAGGAQECLAQSCISHDPKSFSAPCSCQHP